MSQYGYRFGSVWRPPRPVAWLAALLPTLGIVAMQGGIAMLLDPAEPMGMSSDLLHRTPIDNYLLPGIFLLAISAASLVTTVGIVFGWRWQWAEGIERRLGKRWPWIGAIAIALVLLVFELVEVYLFPFHPILHPLLILWTVAILVLAFSERTQDHFWTPPVPGKIGPDREHLHDRH